MADQKITSLSEVSVPATEDLLAWVDDPSGSPVTNKITAARFMGLWNHVCQGRLTLVTGQPVYEPSKALTPSATDTTAETVDFASAHGWVSGTMVTPSATVGGLTLGTVYFVNAADTDTVSFHTTLADGLAGSSKVNLNASITAAIIPLGVQNTSIYFAPYNGNLVSLYDGTRWKMFQFTELTLALGTLTAALPYDVFLYDNTGTLTLELLAWASDTARATALTTQDGVYVKNGATTRRWLGTLRTVSTTATEDSAGGFGQGGKRFVGNYYNRVRRPVRRLETASSWTWSTASWQQANASAVNQVEVMAGLGNTIPLDLRVHGRASGTAAAQVTGVGIGEDSTSAYDVLGSPGRASTAAASVTAEVQAFLHKHVPLGYHYYSWLEFGNGSGTQTFAGFVTSGQHGLTGSVEC